MRSILTSRALRLAILTLAGAGCAGRSLHKAARTNLRDASAVAIEGTHAHVTALDKIERAGFIGDRVMGQPPVQPVTIADVPAARLKKSAVHVEPGGSTRGLEHVPAQVRSPDGRRIARVQTLSVGRESRRSRIVITGPSRRRTTIRTVVNYFGLAWSPDSRKIAFSEGTVVHIADSDGRTRQVIHTGPGGPYPGACFDFVWSDGGRTLSFTQVENAEQLDLSRPVRVVITLDVPEA